jgi:hypothetical protein
MSTKIASIDSYLHNVDIYLQSLFSLICFFCCLIIFTAQFFSSPFDSRLAVCCYIINGTSAYGMQSCGYCEDVLKMWVLKVLMYGFQVILNENHTNLWFTNAVVWFWNYIKIETLQMCVLLMLLYDFGVIYENLTNVRYKTLYATNVCYKTLQQHS